MVYAVWKFRKVHLHEHFLWFSAPTTPPANCICVKSLLRDLGNWWHVTSLYNWRDQSQSEPTLNYKGHFEGKPARVVYWLTLTLTPSITNCYTLQIRLPLPKSTCWNTLLWRVSWTTSGEHTDATSTLETCSSTSCSSFSWPRLPSPRQTLSPGHVSLFTFYCFSPSVKYYTQQ